MFETALRVFLLLICGGVILGGLQAGFWVTKPWREKAAEYLPAKAFEYFPSAKPSNKISVNIEPVGLIEGGKVRQVEGQQIAARLDHRLREIIGLVSQNMTKEVEILREYFGVGAATTGTTQEISSLVLTKQDFSFQAQFFEFDVVGLWAWIDGHLDKKDRVKSMIEIRKENTRLFLDVKPVEGQGSRLIEEAEGELNEIIERAACAIALYYLDEDKLYQGLTAREFCEYLKVYEDYQNFLMRTAERIGKEREEEDTPASSLDPVDQKRVREMTKRFESASFGERDFAAQHIMLATLYSIDQKKDEALERLEKAADIVREHGFVKENLVRWRTEKAERDSKKTQLAVAKAQSPNVGAIQTVYERIRNQKALELINYPEMLELLTTTPVRQKVVVAVFGTGFTPQPGARSGDILPAISTVDGESAEDVNSFGNSVTHLLAALLGENRASVLPIKVLSNNGAGSLSDILEGYLKAVENNAEVLAIPLGGGRQDQASRDVLLSAGIVAVAAAGNNAKRSKGDNGKVDAPANLPGVIAAGAVDSQGQIVDFSPGPKGVSIFLPGIDLLTSLGGSEERKYNGTSYSAVIASAMMAQAKSVDPDLDTEGILKLWEQASQPKADGGPPIIDAKKFIELVAAGAGN